MAARADLAMPPPLEGARTYVGVDGGMSDNPRVALYGSHYEAFLPRRATACRPFAARVVGKHCESGDVLVANAQLPEDTAVGDILAIPVTGAYCHSMASSYNKLLRPPVVFVNDGDYRLVTRRARPTRICSVSMSESRCSGYGGSPPRCPMNVAVGAAAVPITTCRMGDALCIRASSPALVPPKAIRPARRAGVVSRVT